jgi:hypothetical protein
VIYTLLIALLIDSSVILPLKGIIVLFLAIHFKKEWHRGSACSEIKEIQIMSRGNIKLFTEQTHEDYQSGHILIHNPLFFLMKLVDVTQTKKKLIVLFNDQITEEQLRLLHWYIIVNKNHLKN